MKQKTFLLQGFFDPSKKKVRTVTVAIAAVCLIYFFYKTSGNKKRKK